MFKRLPIQSWISLLSRIYFDQLYSIASIFKIILFPILLLMFSSAHASNVKPDHLSELTHHQPIITPHDQQTLITFILSDIHAIGPKQFQLIWKSDLPNNTDYQVCLYDQKADNAHFCQPQGKPTKEQGANVSLNDALLIDNPMFFILATIKEKTYTSQYVYPAEHELTKAIGQHYLPNESYATFLGTQLSISGNGQTLAVIGESYEASYPGKVTSTNNNIHIVYLYQRDPLGWRLHTRLPFMGNIDLEINLDYSGQNLIVSQPDHQTYDLKYQSHPATGIVKHFHYKNEKWQLNQVLHNAITEANTYDLEHTYFGHKAMLSQNGKVLLITGRDPSYAELGAVIYVYRYLDGSWQLADTLASHFSADPLYALSFDVNRDGSRIAINDFHENSVLIYDYQSSDSHGNKGKWQQTNIIDARISGFAEQLSLNGTGKRLAIAAVNEVHLYDNIDGQWQLAHKITTNFNVFTKMWLTQEGRSLYFSVPQNQRISLDYPVLNNPVVVQYKQEKNRWQLNHIFDMQDNDFGWDFALDASGHNLIIGGGENSLDKIYHY